MPLHLLHSELQALDEQWQERVLREFAYRKKRVQGYSGPLPITPETVALAEERLRRANIVWALIALGFVMLAIRNNRGEPLMMIGFIPFLLGLNYYLYADLKKKLRLRQEAEQVYLAQRQLLLDRIAALEATAQGDTSPPQS